LSYKDGKLYITIQKPHFAILKDVERKEDEEGNIYYEIDEHPIYVEGKVVRVAKDLMEHPKEKGKKAKETTEESKVIQFKTEYLKGEKKGEEEKKRGQKKPNIKVQEYEEEEVFYKFIVSREPEYNESEKTLKIELGLQKILENVEERKNGCEYVIKEKKNEK